MPIPNKKHDKEIWQAEQDKGLQKEATVRLSSGGLNVDYSDVRESRAQDDELSLPEKYTTSVSKEQEDLFLVQPMEMSIKETEYKFHKLMSQVKQAKPEVASVKTKSKFVVEELSCRDAHTLTAVKEMYRLDEALDKSQADEWAARQTADQRQLMFRKETEQDASGNRLKNNGLTDNFPAVKHKSINHLHETRNMDMSIAAGPVNNNTTSTQQGKHENEVVGEKACSTAAVDIAEEDASVRVNADTGHNVLPHFVARNIQLACEGNGAGTFAMTDAERERLDRLLEFLDDMNTVPEKEQEHLGYLLTEDTLQTIHDIDSKLEVLGTGTSISGDTPHNETDAHGLTQRRINEINLSLTALRGIDSQEIQPIDETIIQILIGQSTKPQPSSTTSECGEGSVEAMQPTLIEENTGIQKFNSLQDCDTFTSQEIINDLVEEAKAKMPNFKYRHSHHNENTVSVAH